MFLLIYKNLGIAIFQAFSKRNRKATNLSIPFEVRETSLPLFIFVTFHAKTYTNGFPFTSRYPFAGNINPFKRLGHPFVRNNFYLKI